MNFDDERILSIPFKFLVFIFAGLPFSALLISIILSILLNWDESTRTHCNVANFLPSISAAITLEPQKYFWRLFVGIHGTPRMAHAFAIRNLLLKSFKKTFQTLNFFKFFCNFVCFLNLSEIFFLLLLTSVSSTENHEWHKFFMIGFCFCSIFYMIFCTFLYNKSGLRKNHFKSEKSFKFKLFFLKVEILVIFLAIYFYRRHNLFCEPIIYSFFAFCEYFFVIFNILFHSTSFFDFYGQHLSLEALNSLNYQILPNHLQKNV